MEKLAEKLDFPIVYVDPDIAEKAIIESYGIMNVPQVFEVVEGKPVKTLKGRTVLALENEIATRN